MAIVEPIVSEERAGIVSEGLPDLREPEFYIDTIRQIKVHADEARLPYEQRWKEAYRLFNNRYNFGDKLPWQSKNFIPKLSQMIEFAASLLTRAIAESELLFVVEGITARDKTTAGLIHALIDYVLTDQNFKDKLIPALKGALLTGMLAAKVYPAYVHTRVPRIGLGGVELVDDMRLRIRIDFVDIFDLYLDPTGRDKFVIHQIKMDLSDVQALAERGYYDVEVVRQIQEDFRAENEAEEALRRDAETAAERPAHRRQVVLWEYWGDIWDEEGAIVHKNIYCVIANEKYLIVKPRPNPFWHGKPPFVWCGIYPRPFAVYHKGMAEDAIGIQRMVTELINLMLDANYFSSIRAFEVNVGLAVEPSRLVEGIKPGKLFLRHGGVPGERLINEIQIGGVDASSLNMYALLERELQNSTGITEFVMGTPAARGRPTATEVVTGRAQATGLLQHVAQTLETGFIEPMLDMIYTLVLQYWDDFGDPRLQEVLGDIAPELERLDETSRYELLAGNYRFKGRGLSIAVSRAQELNKVMQFLNLLGSIPPLMQVVNMPAIILKLVEGFGWNPKEIISPQALQQIVAQAEAGVPPQPLAMPEQAAQQAPPMPGIPTVQVAAVGAPAPTAMPETEGAVEAGAMPGETAEGEVL